MAVFDINDRSTWNWFGDGQVTCVLPWDQDEYHIDQTDKTHFYQCNNGVPDRQQCAPGMVWNPILNVPDHAGSISEAQIYAWAVDNGKVSPDQRR
jgi:hypothetical protein